MKKLYVDVETTGFDRKNCRIVELAAVYEKDNEIVDEFHVYIYHDKYPEHYRKLVEDVHGLSPEYLVEVGYCEENAFDMLIKFLDKCVNKYDTDDKMQMVGYNVSFDHGFIKELFLRNNHKYFGSYFVKDNLDILKVVRTAKKRKIIDYTENNKLGTIARYFEIDFEAHSAIEDIKTTRKVYQRIKENLVNISLM